MWWRRTMIKFRDTGDWELDGVDKADYPEMTKSFLVNAKNKVEDRPCNKEELDYLNKHETAWVRELARIMVED